VLDLDAVVVGDGGEIETLIPGAQLGGVGLEEGQVGGGEVEAEEGAGGEGEAVHGDIISGETGD